MVLFDASLALLPTAIYAIGNIFSKKAAVKTGGFYSAVVMMGAGVIPIALLVLFSPMALTLYTSIMAIIAGIFLGAGTVLVFKAMETQQVSNIQSLVLVQALLLTIFGVYSLGETLSIVDVAAGAVIIFGCILVSTTEKFRLNQAMLPAVAANILWTLQWIVLSYAINMGGNSNDLLFVARTAGTVVMLMVFLLVVKKKDRKQNRRPLSESVHGVVSGICNGLGTVSYAYLVPLGLFALGGIMQSMNPVLTAILAYLAFRERLTKPQIFGLLIATAGAITIGIFK